MREAFNLFLEMMNKINSDVVKFLFHVQVQKESDVQEASKNEKVQTTDEHKDIFGEETCRKFGGMILAHAEAV